MKNIIFIISIILILSGCGANSPANSIANTNQAAVSKDSFQFVTASGIIKGATYKTNEVEGTPIVFKGQLYSVITGNMQPPNIVNTVSIDNMIAGQHIITIPIGNRRFGSALVYNNTVYIFFTENIAGNDNGVYYISSTDLINWSPQYRIFSDPSNHIYNTSIIYDGKQFVMAYEIAIPEIVKFAVSPDMANWSIAGKAFTGIDGTYAACPTIRYDVQYGKYYILYMAIVQGNLYTFITRTQDFITFENATPINNEVPFAPLPDLSEGCNNSDVDLAEFNGKTYFSYAVGDQVSWLNMKTAIYNGSMIQYLRSFYPAP